MWQQFFKDYFTFTRKERTGILLLLVAIALLWLIPQFIEPATNKLTASEIEEFKAEAANLHRTTQKEDSGLVFEEKTLKKSFPDPGNPLDDQRGVLFEFDPNTLSLAGWRKLGLRDKTIRTIQNFLAKGGHFYKPEDIGKIFGLTESEYETLLPYVSIREDKKQTSAKSHEAGSGGTGFLNPVTNKSAILVNINTADSAGFEALPGIGSKLASRIINFRSRLGGFHNVAQVAETYGLHDSVFQRIRHRLVISPEFIPTIININLADVKTLQAHPYIRFTIANAIVQYRLQHGLFIDISDLQKIDLITPDLLVRIRPYLTI